jgi:hypothetical protein
MKILNSRVHGALDYLAVIFLWSAPIIFNLNECVSLLSYLLGGIHLVLTALTDFPLGWRKIIPLKMHSRIELTVSIVLIITPLFIGNLIPIDSQIDEFFFACFGMFVLIIWFISDYNDSVQKSESLN